jgi:hypothetical protein
MDFRKTVMVNMVYVVYHFMVFGASYLSLALFYTANISFSNMNECSVDQFTHFSYDVLFSGCNGFF